MSVSVRSGDAYDTAELEFLQSVYDLAMNELKLNAGCPARQHEALAKTVLHIAPRHESDVSKLAHRAAALMEQCDHGAECPVPSCRLRRFVSNPSSGQILQISLTTEQTTP